MKGKLLPEFHENQENRARELQRFNQVAEMTKRMPVANLSLSNTILKICQDLDTDELFLMSELATQLIRAHLNGSNMSKDKEKIIEDIRWHIDFLGLPDEKKKK